MKKFRLLDRLNEIKILLKTGQVSYDEAHKKALPIIVEMNQVVLKIAKKHKVQPKLISFPSFMR